MVAGGLAKNCSLLISINEKSSPIQPVWRLEGSLVRVGVSRGRCLPAPRDSLNLGGKVVNSEDPAWCASERMLRCPSSAHQLFWQGVSGWLEHPETPAIRQGGVAEAVSYLPACSSASRAWLPREPPCFASRLTRSICAAFAVPPSTAARASLYCCVVAKETTAFHSRTRDDAILTALPQKTIAPYNFGHNQTCRVDRVFEYAAKCRAADF